MAPLYGNDAFPILVRSTKKWYSSFLKKKFRLQKKKSFRFLENLFES